jgi:hypothetical protein
MSGHKASADDDQSYKSRDTAFSNDETLVQVHSMSPYVSVQEGE